MKLIVVLTIATTISGMASAFTPSSKNKVASSNKNNVIMSPNSRVHVGVSTTSNNMVSMSSPFWNMSPSRSAAPAVASKTIVDRDYTVAATLLMVYNVGPIPSQWVFCYLCISFLTYFLYGNNLNSQCCAVSYLQHIIYRRLHVHWYARCSFSCMVWMFVSID